jgi:hypothetical protein
MACIRSRPVAPWPLPNAKRMLTLKRASKSRPDGEWSDDDFDVFDGEQQIGRIMLHPQAPEDEGGKLSAISRALGALPYAGCKRWRISRRGGAFKSMSTITHHSNGP